jgi:predicted ArsR family transcriptional regulator
MAKQKPKIHLLPKLANDVKRVNGSEKLHPITKERIRALAKKYKTSMSAVKNIILSQYCKNRDEFDFEDIGNGT